MVHDIAHCNYESCKRKKKCYRYLAFVELKEKKLSGLYSFIRIKEPNKCEHFMSLKIRDTEQ